MPTSIMKITGVPIFISRSGQSAMMKYRKYEMKEEGYIMPAKNVDSGILWEAYILLIQGTDIIIR